jgi:class 3 adenylate cyclase/WD40 repeat protein
VAERRIADRYEPIEVLGRGGEAMVLKAIDTRHGRLVALKVRAAPSGESDGLLGEARLLLSLPSHPGLAHARDDLFDGGRHVLVLDWVDGVDLGQLLTDRGRPGLPASTVLRWAAHAAEALMVLHAQGVVHGDVKPANLIVDRTGRVVLVDLGSSSVPDTTLPSGGTPGYRAPEVAAGAPATCASDVYGLAATVFTLLTGAPPSGGVPAWGDLGADAAQRLEVAIRAGLSIDPDRRPPTPGAFVERLRAGWDDATPTGVATVVLTDVVGLGELWERSPHEVPGLLAAMQLTVDRSVELHRGHRGAATAEGGATVSLFPSALDAVMAAIEVQRDMQLEDGSMCVRVGLATGELVVIDGNAVGPTVNRAARVRDLAGPGEVLLSASTAEVVGRALPSTIELLFLGTHGLREIGPDDVVAVTSDGIASPPDPARRPYQGLAPFTRDQADLYVGREREIARAQSLLESNGFVAIVGASGSGKTSLALAGLAPRLGEVIVVRPTADPARSLQEARLGDHTTHGLVVDQLEELVTLCDDATERAAFVAAMLAHPGGLVVTVRADLYGEFGVYPELTTRLAQSQVLLGVMDASEVVRAVEEPARRCGLEVEPGLAEVIAHELGSAPGSLPLLGHALLETWLRRDARTITFAAYRASGGVESAVAATADRALGTLDDDQRAVTRRLLLQMIELRRDGDDARRWASRRELMETDPERAADVVRVLTDARLLVVDGENVTLVHEALLRAWPTLRQWVSAERRDLLARQEVRLDATRWVTDGRNEADLYRGARLETALDLSSRAAFPRQEAEFLESGRALRDREQLDARRRSRRLVVLASVASVLAILAAAVGVVAVVQRGDAQRSRSAAENAATVAEESARAAQIEALVGRAESIRVTQRDTAALLAAQAFRFADSPTTRASLFSNFTAGASYLDTHRVDDLGGRLGGYGIVLPDGETAFYTGADGRLRPYDLDTGALGDPWVSITSEPDAYPLLEASPDGRLVAQGVWQGSGETAHGVVAVFDAMTGELRFPPIVLDAALTAGTFSADGERLILSMYPDARLIALDTATGAVAATAPGVEIVEPLSQSFSLATSGDQVVVGTSRPGTLRVLDSETLELQHTYEIAADHAEYMADGGQGTVVKAGPAGVARFVLATGGVAWVRPARDACGPLAVLPNRDLVFCGNIFGRLEERDLETGLVLRNLGAQNGNTGLMWPADDGHELVAFGASEPVVSRWRLDGTGPITSVVAPGFDPVAFSPNADLLAVNRGEAALGDYAAQVVDVETGDVVADLFGLLGIKWFADDVLGGAIADSDGNGRLATVALDGTEPVFGGAVLDPLPIAAEVTAGKDRALLLWRAPDGGTVFRTFDEATSDLGPRIMADTFNSFSISRSGHRVAIGTGTERGIDIYDGFTGKLVDNIGGLATSGYITPADQLFVTSFGGELTLHDLETLEPIRTYGGSRGYIQEVFGTLDGATIAVRGGDRSVTLYDVATGVRLGTPLTIADDAAFAQVTIAPDGSRIALAGTEGTIIWELDPQVWLEGACRIAGRNLTRQEWDTHIGDLAPYAATCPEFPIEQ